MGAEEDCLQMSISIKTDTERVITDSVQRGKRGEEKSRKSLESFLKEIDSR